MGEEPARWTLTTKNAIPQINPQAMLNKRTFSKYIGKDIFFTERQRCGTATSGSRRGNGVEAMRLRQGSADRGAGSGCPPPSCSACWISRTATGVELYRRTWNRPIGAKYTAISFLGLELLAALGAIPKKLTCVRRHLLSLLVSAMWAGDGRF